jgi:1-acyl-sn-glycerol-3-phosphate acyltransferase
MNVFKSIIVWFLAISFLVVMFPISLIIWTLVLPFDKNRVVIHRILTWQGILLMRLLSASGIEIQGRDKVVRGTTYVIISNHQSILDTLLLFSLKYKFKWISKIENVRVPILGWYLKLADYIIVDRGNEESKIEMLEKSYRCLKKGISIMIFPEGTRSKDSKIGLFKRGAFQLAIEANVPILPVLIDGTGNLLPKNKLVLETSHGLSFRILDPIQPDTFNTKNPDELAGKISSMYTIELKRLRDNNLAL